MPATYEENRRLAHARQPDGPFPGLAREMRRLMGHDPDPTGGERPYLSSREAEAACGVNRSTIADGLRGRAVSAECLLKIAFALRGDPFTLLQLSGYPARQMLAVRAAGGESGLSEGEHALVALFRRLSPASRRLLLALAGAVEDNAPPDNIPRESETE